MVRAATLEACYVGLSEGGWVSVVSEGAADSSTSTNLFLKCYIGWPTTYAAFHSITCRGRLLGTLLTS